MNDQVIFVFLTVDLHSNIYVFFFIKKIKSIIFQHCQAKLILQIVSTLYHNKHVARRLCHTK
jgi:hypothetical protein